MSKTEIMLVLLLAIMASGCVGKGINMSGNFTVSDGNVSVQPTSITLDAGAITESISNFVRNVFKIPLNENESDSVNEIE